MSNKFLRPQFLFGFFLFFVHMSNVSAQTGGNTVYNFLNLVPNARIAALGGYAPAVRDHDLNIGLINPALLNKEMHNQLALNYLNFV